MAAKLMALAALVLLHSASADLLDDCKADPTNSSCTNSADFYNDATVAMNVKMLCEKMPQMPSCTIRQLCEAGTIPQSSGHCGDWNVLAGICSTQYGESMQGMGGCATYKEICVDGSVVANCNAADKKGPVELITTAEAKTAAMAYCAANPDAEFDIDHMKVDMDSDSADMDMDMGNGNMRRAGMTKVCEECDSIKCQMAVAIVANGCKTDMTQSFCTELKKMCDANENLNDICTFADAGSSAGSAARHSRLILVLSFISSLVFQIMGPRL